MAGAKAIRLDQIEGAVKALSKIRPVYSGMLSFYGKIFMAQEMRFESGLQLELSI
jgi:hypothetical protein